MDDLEFTTGQVQNIFGVARETVRNWTTEFARHLSPTATPGKGQHRKFTGEDMRVLTLIAEMRSRNVLYEEIHASLDAGARGEVPPLDFNALARSEQSQQLIMLQTALAQTASERDALKEQLGIAKTEVDQERGKVSLLKEQLAASQLEIRKLYREIADLESGNKSE